MRKASDAKGRQLGATIETAIEVTVNGEHRSVQQPCTVKRLLESLSLGPKRVAVAVNRDVVPRSAFPSRQLNSGDRVEILEAVGGGA